MNLKNLKPNLTWMQVLVFFLVWISYASVYLLRKPFGIIKSSIKESMDLSENVLGNMELSFSIPYAFGSVFLGFLGDKLGPRLTLGICIIGSAAATSVMGIYNNYYILLVLLFISGLFQSLAAPAALTIQANWFSKEKLTIVMCFWSTCMVVGSILSTLITVKIVEISSWHNVFYIPAGIALVVGILELIFMRNNKKDKNDTDEKMEIQGQKSIPVNQNKEETKEGTGKRINRNNNEETSSEVFEVNINKEIGMEEKLKRETSLNVWQVLHIREVPWASSANFFIKGIRNAIFFWLPYYLSTVLGFSESDAGFISLVYEVGSFFGPCILSIIFNLILDDLLASMLSIFLTALFTLLLLIESSGNYLLYISLFCSGAFTTTADTIFGAAFIAKISRKHGSKSSIISVVNGIGSIGNIVEGPLVAYLSFWFGMKALIPCIVIFCALSVMCLFWLFILQTREERKLNEDEIKKNNVVLKSVVSLPELYLV